MSTPELPTGTVTFLFTDIEGSTRLLQTLGNRYPEVLEDQRRLLRAAFDGYGGYEAGTQGDGFFVVFRGAREAVAAAVEAQRAVASYQWPVGATVKVRMGLHTGEGNLSGNDYVGLDVHRAARISSVGSGGQILLSQSTHVLIDHDPPDGTALRDLGPHRLKDLHRPEHLFQVVHPDLPADFPPLRSLNVLVNNLPVQLTSFIGREQEMAEAKRLLTTSRLLTLLGSGGAGKTRLAIQVAADYLDVLPDGAWLVDLAPISDPGLVPQTVASVLGQWQPGRPPVDVLVDYLQTKTLLLIMDNCEHILAAVADLSAVLLRACPNLRILATSREPLGVTGEASFRVPSLPLPQAQHLSSPGDANQYAAMRLFVERAVLYQPAFKVTPANVSAIAEISRRLDGIPLAIELAAARIKVLSVEQIAARLDDRLRLLTGGARTGLPHHQTLRAAMDWSYDLLDGEERALFRRLAVFVGGFGLEAAEGACAGGGIEPGAILDLLARLVDKSLVAVEEAANGEARYRLLETIRRYGMDRFVEAGEAEAIRGRHRDYFVQFAGRAELRLRGPEQKIWLDRLEAEYDNFRAALEWAMADRSGAEAGLRLAGALWWFWEVRGYWPEGRQWLREALDRAEEASAAVRIKALTAASSLALRSGDIKIADELARQSLNLSRELGDKRGEASCLAVLGIEACILENYTQAEAMGAESLSLSEQIGDNWGTAWALVILGLVAREQREYVRATALIEDSLTRMRALGHQWGAAIALTDLGLIARDLDQMDRAARLLDEALALFQQVGDRTFSAHAQIHLGTIVSAQGDYTRAVDLYRSSLATRRELRERRGIASCLAALGCAAAGLEQFVRAAKIFGAAEALRESLGAGVPAFFRAHYDRQVAVAAERLGEASLKAAWSEGRVMTLDQAIDFALSDDGLKRTP